MLESVLNKVAGLKVFNFIKKKLQRMCITVNIAQFFRTGFGDASAHSTQNSEVSLFGTSNLPC